MKDLRVPEKRFRPEIEGVRAVAALLVAVYHIWLGSVSGGVDVFFIVSGYLITTSLLSRMERQGKIDLIGNILGLAKRLFPVAFTVILTIILGSIYVMPKVQWEQIVSEAYASALYFQNWELAFNSVDYLAQNNEASPFQHFWALSIQGQFYITWPFVILLAYFIARKILKTPVRVTLLGILILLFVSSLSYSVYKTEVNQPWAYFDTLARVWEFSLGGILALLLPYLKFKKPVTFVMGWLGLAIICLTGILLPVSTVFPGYAALLPTTGVIFVLLAAENGNKFGVEKLLGSKPFTFFGSISYGFYLWHWPLLVFYYTYFDKEQAPLWVGISVLLITAVLAYLSIKFIETPIRKMDIKQSKLKPALVLLAIMLPVLAVNTSWQAYVNADRATAGQYEEKDYPGALAIYEDIKPAEDVEPAPDGLKIKEDLPAFYDNPDCYSNMNDNRITKCSKGDTDNPEHTIALVGGSHSGHWYPALAELADDLHLQIDIYNKDACRFSTQDFDGKLNKQCMEWNDEVLKLLKEDPPDLVVTTANVNDGAKVPDGYKEQFKNLDGIAEIFAIRDTPRSKVDTPICVEESENYMEECSRSRDSALSENPPWENTEGISDNVTFADLSEYFCDEDTCPPVIGNVIVYRDYHHLSTLYSKTLAKPLKEHLVKALEEKNL
ncbi:acyltransferase family protein [Radiobacillus deserti]|uniref:Acyltransferase n=1 Tax=Radiobacillus deserti TaxID=2594883 RepID=A0A516KE12_9BACI|nr:acyltransferase family protein [Radiobacillus deserti]QDP39641.1 acyltransferase [Radiobacillus deserti]